LADLERLAELAIDDNPLKIIDPLNSCLALRSLSLNGVPAVTFLRYPGWYTWRN